MTSPERDAAVQRIIGKMVLAVNRNAQRIKPEPWMDVCAQIAAEECKRLWDLTHLTAVPWENVCPEEKP